MFDTTASQFLDSPLAQIYYDLRSEVDERTGKPYTHAVALWAAWMGHRQKANDFKMLESVGLPSTADEFARIAGVSARTLRNYNERYGELVKSSQDKAVRALLGGYRLNVVQALAESAMMVESTRAADRRTFLQLTGDLVARHDVTSGDQPLPAPLVQVYLPDNNREDNNDD